MARIDPASLSLARLFLRFLRFGALAWGGPVAQLGLLKRELVEEEGWVTAERFNRTLAVYQALPGPEAHEMCVWFGTVARGRWGGLVAGLGFMLPGLLLMLAASWLYVAHGLGSPLVAAAFAGCQVAVVALVIRAVHRIGAHAVADASLLALASVAFVAHATGVPLWPILLGAGLLRLVHARGHSRLATGLLLVVAAVVVARAVLRDGSALEVASAVAGPLRAAAPHETFVAGLRAGCLTFGGAYTAIPFLQHDAVETGRWLTSAQFLDGIAIGGILPAPLVIFGTFVGYLAGGLGGALLLTAGLFLPAFAITLVGHELLERLVHQESVHALLDGIMAGVVGLIAATALELTLRAVSGVAPALLLLACLAASYAWKARGAVAGIVLGAGAIAVLQRLAGTG